MNRQQYPIKNTTRIVAVTLVLIGCFAALTTHLGVLYFSGLDPVSSPIGALAWTEKAPWFKYGVWLFACGHLALVFLLNRPDAGRMTRAAQFFVLLDTLLIACLPFHFASVGSAAELDTVAYGSPLWLLGGTAGFAMTFVSLSLWRRHRATAFMTLICLLLWSVLASVFLGVDASWIGAYQRFVGAVLLFWSAMLAIRLGLSKL